MKISGYGIIGIIISLIAGTILVTQPDVSAQSAISITGLATLQQTAQDSLPYSVAMADGKPTFIEFYANWCTTCQSIAPIISQLHQNYGDAINFVMVNIDDPQYTKILEQYQVTGVPQITLLDNHHQVTWSEVGKIPATILKSVLTPLSST
jgi:thiol-disulfide isomerase/thioredoxin